MKSVQIEHVTKFYGPLRALDDVSVTIGEGELFFLLGPSGCGKTTLLRSIAGFVHPEQGSIKIGDVESINLRPQERQTAMVFQSYALWPHMSIFENVAFGLRLQKIDKAEIKRRTEEALALVRMESQAGKKPNMLSGGQQQRISLARALVVRPACLLLDEPLSNLDAKLREEMRNEIRRICKQNGLTGVYVTHDQKEALAIADRIAVMNQGKIAQIGTPNALYRHPNSRFVADFLGQANLLAGTIREANNGSVVVDSALGILKIAAADYTPKTIGQRVSLVVRPEAVSLRPFFHGIPPFKARVQESTFLGELVQQRILLQDQVTELMTLGLCGDYVPDDDNPIHDWWVDPRQVALLPAEN
jgi:iron(III) transport system ATP-binding protein